MRSNRRGASPSKRSQADGVSDLVDRLFDLSRVTVGRFDVDRRPTDLVAIARRLVGTAAVLDAALAVELSVPADRSWSLRTEGASNRSSWGC